MRQFGVDEAFTPTPIKKTLPIEFSSFIKQDFELEKGEYRLSDVNCRACIPVDKKTVFGLTREDVIHR